MFGNMEASSKPKSGRDSRRSFSQSQKNQILYQQDSKCAVCHRKLDPRDREYDHKKAWAANGKTVTQNGRAVCGSCHNIITHNQTVKKSDNKLNIDEQAGMSDMFNGGYTGIPNTSDIIGLPQSPQQKKGRRKQPKQEKSAMERLLYG